MIENSTAAPPSFDVGVVGAGFGSLTAAALLAKAGQRVVVAEQAAYPGGCASTYRKKGYWFETGATTLVGLDEHMPLRYLLDRVPLQVPLRKLEPPMQVHLPDGQLLTRYQNLDQWIQEAERVFGRAGQRPFWELCYRLSRQVWQTATEQLHFPPASITDLWHTLQHVSGAQLRSLPYLLQDMAGLLQRFGLHRHELFVRFIDEQLLITAQNYHHEVNALFGAAALCYTNYGNYYVEGGLLRLAEPLVQYIRQQPGCEVLLNTRVTAIREAAAGYALETKRGPIVCRQVVAGLPLQNTAELLPEGKLKQQLQKQVLPAERQHGAFTMSLVLRKRPLACLHHQVHLIRPLPQIGSRSVFISFSHPADTQRCGLDEMVAAVSTHVPDPAAQLISDKDAISEAILEALAQRGLLQRDEVKLQFAATPGAWIRWTGRALGAVGGYPQFRDRMPWQMPDARLKKNAFYLCGDTVYPGQGIPGTCLSGIIAAQKLLSDL